MPNSFTAASARMRLLLVSLLSYDEFTSEKWDATLLASRRGGLRGDTGVSRGGGTMGDAPPRGGSATGGCRKASSSSFANGSNASAAIVARIVTCYLGSWRYRGLSSDPFGGRFTSIVRSGSCLGGWSHVSSFKTIDHRRRTPALSNMKLSTPRAAREKNHPRALSITKQTRNVREMRDE